MPELDSYSFFFLIYYSFFLFYSCPDNNIQMLLTVIKNLHEIKWNSKLNKTEKSNKCIKRRQQSSLTYVKVHKKNDRKLSINCQRDDIYAFSKHSPAHARAPDIRIAHINNCSPSVCYVLRVCHTRHTRTFPCKWWLLPVYQCYVLNSDGN